MTTSTKPRAAGIYVRISQDDSGEGAGVTRQEKDALALAERLGWTVAEVFVENDTSAFKKRKVRLASGRTAMRVDRPEFRRMLDLIEAGRIDGLVAYHLDRVARDPRDLEDLIDVTEQTSIQVESVTGSLRLATDSDITMARVAVAVANQSSRDASRRIRRKHEALAQEGKYAGGGIRRFGFERDGVTHIPHEADAIRWAASRVIDGAAARAVARELDDLGVKPVKAATWSSKTIIDVLRSPRVAGKRSYQGEVVGPAVWEPILDEQTYAAVVAILAERSAGKGKPALNRWLNQVLFCGLCGTGLRGWSGSRGAHRYWCSPSHGGCGKIAIHAEHTEAEISRQVLELLENPGILQSLTSADSATGAEHARTDLAADEAQLRELASMFGNREITKAEYLEARKPIEDRMSGAKAILRNVVPPRVRKIIEADSVVDAWEQAYAATKRDLARMLVRGWKVAPADRSRGGRYQSDRLEAIPHEEPAAA